MYIIKIINPYGLSYPNKLNKGFEGNFVIHNIFIVSE